MKILTTRSRSYLCLITFSVALLTALCFPNASSAQQPYILKMDISDNGTLLRMHHRESKKEIWRYKAQDVGKVQWSKDGRAVAVALDYPHRLLIWRSGHRLRSYPTEVNYHGGRYDGVMDIVWSPDYQRLLFRVGASGDGTLGKGGLYCLKLSDGRINRVSYEVSKMSWASSRKVHYWKFHAVKKEDSYTYFTDKNPRTWFAP